VLELDHLLCHAARTHKNSFHRIRLIREMSATRSREKLRLRPGHNHPIATLHFIFA
jgi:hypothetical protein